MEQKVAALNRGEVPIYESQVPELLQRHSGKRLRFSVHARAAVTASDVVFLAVGTPQSESTEKPTFRKLRPSHGRLLPVIHRSTLIVEKSTVPVCTCDALRELLLGCGARRGWFSVASNPEFLREGSAVTDFLYPDRIVVGADDDFGRCLLREVYMPLASGPCYGREDAVPCSTQGKPTRARLLYSPAPRALS